jgi:peroxiredoxin
VKHNRQLANGLGLEFPVLSDANRDTIAAYGVVHAGAGIDGSDIARPATFIVGVDGRIAWRNLTDNWRVRIRPEVLLEALEDVIEAQ